MSPANEHQPEFEQWWASQDTEGLSLACKWSAYNAWLAAAQQYVGEMADGFPRFIKVSERHEICRFDNGEWSLRLTEDDDVKHVRYLKPDEKVLVEAAFRAGCRCEPHAAEKG